jgi:hypothetical protein
MAERRSTKDRRRVSRHGRRDNDPRPVPLALPDRPLSRLLDDVMKRVGAIEKMLHIQFQRIAQLQVVMDRLGLRGPAKRDRSTKTRN